MISYYEFPFEFTKIFKTQYSFYKKASTLYESIQTVKSVEVVTNKADCLNNRCMHEALIIENPYNPLGYDDGDYTLFNSNGREVQSAYLNPNILLNTINS